MKVLLLNGSPRGDRCTKCGLKIVSEELLKNGIESEIFDIDNKPIIGCTGCGGCSKTGLCVFKDDGVNEVIEKMKECDGIIIGTPVHYASASGAITSFMDRVSFAGGSALKYKVGAAIASCRRGGASATLDQLNKYFTILNMPIASSNYWNMIHGSNAEDVLKDEEGVQTLKILAQNTAWLLKCIDMGKKNGINIPEAQTKIKTDFIR